MSRRIRRVHGNWYRYLWCDLRSCERQYARQSRWLAEQRHSFFSHTPEHAGMMAAAGSLLLALARSADRDRRELGL